VIYGLGNVELAAAHRLPPGAVVLLMTSIFVFLFGLISEQIAAMRFENTQRADDGLRTMDGGRWTIDDGRRTMDDGRGMADDGRRMMDDGRGMAEDARGTAGPALAKDGQTDGSVAGTEGRGGDGER
jgi:hypothetical protein